MDHLDPVVAVERARMVHDLNVTPEQADLEKVEIADHTPDGGLPLNGNDSFPVTSRQGSTGDRFRSKRMKTSTRTDGSCLELAEG